MRTRSLKPKWRGSGLLTRRPVDRNHSRPPRTSYRSGRTGRTLNPLAQAHCRFESCLVLCVPVPQWQRERVESAFSARSSRARHTIVVDRGEASWLVIALRCYASGEAARLSIERDGFESRTARQFLECSGASKRSSFGTKRSLVQIQPLRPFSARDEKIIARIICTASALACSSVL